MVEHKVESMTEKSGRKIVFVDGKRITAFNKEEAFCDAEVTIKKYEKLFNQAKTNNKLFNALKGRIIKESDNLMHPKHAEEYLTERLKAKW